MEIVASDHNPWPNASEGAKAFSYKHAYETTAADRDRLIAYEHAFNTTVADRDEWLARCTALANAAQWAIDNADLLSTPTAAPLSGPNPQMVCVGAQKCATSFLYSAIREHPLVTVEEKDVELTSQAPITFQAQLIEQLGSIEAIKAMNPDARILICTRDPIDRMVSEYKMRVRQGKEIRDFVTAINAPEAVEVSRFHGYIRRSHYAEDIRRYRAAFERVLVLDANGNAGANLFRLFSFMGIRDLNSLQICSNPPMKYAGISSAGTQAAGITPEQRNLHNFTLSDSERLEISDRYFQIEYQCRRDTPA